MTIEIPTPEFLKDRGELMKFAWPNMRPDGWTRGRGTDLESDPNAEFGKALAARGREDAQHDMSNS